MVFDTGNQAVADCSVYRSWRRDCILVIVIPGTIVPFCFIWQQWRRWDRCIPDFVQCRACGSDSVCILVPGNEVSAHRSGWICAGIVNYVYFELQIHIIKEQA